MLEHVLSIKGSTASADSVTWSVDPAALTTTTGEDLFEALFPAGPGRDWYDGLDPDSPLYIDADEALEDAAWELLCDGEDDIVSTRGVARVVEGSEARTTLNLGLSYETALCLDEAFACFDEARLMFEEEGDRPGELLALQYAGRTLSMQGDEDLAESYLDDALELARDLGDKNAEGHTLNALAQVYMEDERWEEVADTFEEALECMREAEERGGEAGVLNNLGMMYCELERWAEAKASFEQALAIYEAIGLDAAMVPVVCNTATLWQLTGDETAATAAICRAMSLALQADLEGLLTVSQHALQMGYDAAEDKNWELLSRLGEALQQVLGPVDEKEPDPDEVDALEAATMLAQMASGLMFAAGQARGDQTHPAIAQTVDLVRQFDEISGDLLGLGEWLDAVCDQGDGGLRMI